MIWFNWIEAFKKIYFLVKLDTRIKMPDYDDIKCGCCAKKLRLDESHVDQDKGSCVSQIVQNKCWKKL